MSKERILYIDDEVDLLDLAQSFFEDENLPLKTCSDFHEAIDLIRNNHYDLIISDAKMPSGSGFEIFKIIKAEGIFKGKIILVTGNLETPPHSDKLGYDLVIYKPVKFQELIEKAKIFLGEL
jgi:two-component system response regulator PilR (NtrC family)